MKVGGSGGGGTAKKMEKIQEKTQVRHPAKEEKEAREKKALTFERGPTDSFTPSRG